MRQWDYAYLSSNKVSTRMNKNAYSTEFSAVYIYRNRSTQFGSVCFYICVWYYNNNVWMIFSFILDGIPWKFQLEL